MTTQAHEWRLAQPKVDWRNWVEPHKIFDDPAMTIAEKRAVLMSWISQAEALPNYPSVHQLKNGQLVSLDGAKKALERLDALPTIHNKTEDQREAPAPPSWPLVSPHPLVAARFKRRR